MKVEIDITYECNLNCKYCNRFCDIIKTKEYLSLDKINKINNLLKPFKKDLQISLLGGEPFLHPQIEEIIALFLTDEIVKPIKIKTNNFGRIVQTKIKKLENKYKVDFKIEGKRFNKKMDADLLLYINTSDSGEKVIDHRKIMIAPVDFGIDPRPFINNCKVLNNCGMCINNYGFYLCSNAANMDRIFGFDVGYKHVPSSSDLDIHKNIFCNLCSYIFNYTGFPDKKIEKSKSWEVAYNEYKKSPPKLTPL